MKHNHDAGITLRDNGVGEDIFVIEYLKKLGVIYYDKAK